MERETDAQKLAITEAILREQEADLNSLFNGIAENIPHCWETEYPGAEIMMCVAYVHHLESAVGPRAHNLSLTRHHLNCDGTCHINPCPLCAAKEEARPR
jgi:hypothetical protein